MALTFCPALETGAASFGNPRPKTYLTGADCPRLHREGQIQTVLTYCCVDVATTARAYQLMTATAPDLDRPRTAPGPAPPKTRRPTILLP